MTTQATTPVHQQNRQGLWSLVGMTASTLVLVGGVMLWQVQQRSGNGAVMVRPVATASASDQELYGRSQAGRLAGSTPIRTSPADATMALYVVASDQAAELRATFESSAPVDFQYKVLVADATEDGNRVLDMIGQLAAVNDELGLPAMVVVDLRARAVQPQEDLAPACGGPIGDCRD
jgi:hypothetical protein